MPYVSGDLVAQLVAEVRRLADRLDAQHAGVVTGADAALLAAVFAVARDREFRSAELLEMAVRDDAASAALRMFLGHRSAKAIGKLLAPLAGRPSAAGLMLVCVGRIRGSKTWRVSYLPKPASA